MSRSVEWTGLFGRLTVGLGFRTSTIDEVLTGVERERPRLDPRLALADQGENRRLSPGVDMESMLRWESEGGKLGEERL